MDIKRPPKSKLKKKIRTVILIVVGLTFFPALAIGPIVEHLAAINGQTF